MERERARLTIEALLAEAAAAVRISRQMERDSRRSVDDAYAGVRRARALTARAVERLKQLR